MREFSFAKLKLSLEFFSLHSIVVVTARKRNANGTKTEGFSLIGINIVSARLLKQTLNGWKYSALLSGMMNKAFK